MKVKDLIEQLSKADPNRKVYLASDPEGNGFLNAYEVDFDLSMYRGDPSSKEDLEEYPEDDPIFEEMEKVVIIWP